jgi:hypothetical protein
LSNAAIIRMLPKSPPKGWPQLRRFAAGLPDEGRVVLAISRAESVCIVTR